MAPPADHADQKKAETVRNRGEQDIATLGRGNLASWLPDFANCVGNVELTCTTFSSLVDTREVLRFSPFSKNF